MRALGSHTMSDKPVQILVVDDDEAKRYGIVRLLRSQGFSITEAGSGREALERAQERPDLVVLDVRLPDMNGFDVCRRLKQDRLTSGILVLHMSATLVDSQHRAEGLDAGADGYLTDAAHPSEFLATVRALLRARNAERALRESERRFELLVRSVSDHAIFTCDEQTRIVSWNEGVERVLGYPADRFVNRTYASVFASRPEFANDLDVARRDGQLEYERWVHHEDGSRFYAAGSVTAIIGDGGEIAGFVSVVRDATERRQFEDERAELLAAEHEARAHAERLNRLKDEFLATLSHELRTPLSAILGWTQLMQADRLSAEEMREGIGVIDRNAQAQAQLIEDLLDVTRIISGKLRLTLERVDLAVAINGAIESIRTAADARRIRIDVDSAADAGAISADPTRLQQILWNLLSNAVKFTPENGDIKIQARRLENHIEITVTDNGQGIEPQFLPYVFDRFRQADGSTTRSKGGLGLGLAIVRHLTELHGGTIEAQSAGKGYGATFRLRLPLASPVLAPNAPSETVLPAGPSRGDGETPDLAGRTVLVVEDDPDGRALICKLLSRCGAKVQAAENAAQGKELFQAARPDLLISDIGMPNEDGYSFIRRIREVEAGSTQPVPAIALTAYAQSDDRRRALRAGFQMHLPKPVVPAELLAAVGSLCARNPR